MAERCRSCGTPLDAADEEPSAVLRRAAAEMRADTGSHMPGSFVGAVADWLEILAAAEDRKLPDDSGTVHVARRIARAYLADRERADLAAIVRAELPDPTDGDEETVKTYALIADRIAERVLADGRFGRLEARGD